MKRISRKPSDLSEFLHRRLNSYALAASTAGVGMLALAQPAEGKIVYTPAHQNCENGFIQIDLNHGGFVDFVIACNSNAYGTDSGGTANVLVLSGSNGGSNLVAGYDLTIFQTFFSTVRLLPFASALPAGARVNTAKVDQGLLALRSCFPSCKSFGQWLKHGKGVKDHYLGLKFTIKGKYHYGWARFKVSVAYHGLDAILTGYAYETIPNKPIITGKTKGPDVVTLEPASLGHLARGASAIRAWRGKESR